jgi:hypothetical protein
MPTRRKSDENEILASCVCIGVSEMGEWERRMVRKFGLEDVPFKPEEDCELCRKRAARRKVKKELARSLAKLLN